MKVRREKHVEGKDDDTNMDKNEEFEMQAM